MIPHRAKKIGDPFSIMVYYIMVGIMDSLYHYMEIAYKHLNQHLVGFPIEQCSKSGTSSLQKTFPSSWIVIYCDHHEYIYI